MTGGRRGLVTATVVRAVVHLWNHAVARFRRQPPRVKALTAIAVRIILEGGDLRSVRSQSPR
jgi:hypothetical protein